MCTAFAICVCVCACARAGGAIKSLLEHTCGGSYTGTNGRSLHICVLAPSFAPDPILLKVLGVSGQRCSSRVPDRKPLARHA